MNATEKKYLLKARVETVESIEGRIEDLNDRIKTYMEEEELERYSKEDMEECKGRKKGLEALLEELLK